MERKINEIRKELRTRVKFAITDILELIEKENGTSVRYEELPWLHPKQMRITVFSNLIRATTLKGILKIIKQNGLKVESMMIEKLRGEIALEIIVTLKDGEKHDE